MYVRTCASGDVSLNSFHPECIRGEEKGSALLRKYNTYVGFKEITENNGRYIYMRQCLCELASFFLCVVCVGVGVLYDAL